MTTKQALDEAMGFAAAHTNRVRALMAVSQIVSPLDFEKLAGQNPDTLRRDLQWAEQDFQRIKAEYEKHCAEIGAPAYATYNED